MRRTRTAKERVGLPDAVTLKCPCGKRLALLEIRPAGYASAGPSNLMADGPWFVPYRTGEPVVADYWRQPTCPVCGRSPQVRGQRLVELIQGAKARGAKSVTLTEC